MGKRPLLQLGVSAGFIATFFSGGLRVSSLRNPIVLRSKPSKTDFAAGTG